MQANYTNTCEYVQAQRKPAGQRAHSISTRIEQLNEIPHSALTQKPQNGPCVPPRQANRALWTFHPWARISQTARKGHSGTDKPDARIDRTTFQILYGKEAP
ncbi:hypothetical protein I050019G5_10530 [Collinsella sp. i05-0019-G5]